MPKYRKKPVEIEAVQFDGTSAHSAALRKWMLGGEYKEPDVLTRDFTHIEIQTLEGVMTAYVGDYIIKEPFPTGDRQFYPCKPDIFEQTYEAVDG